ncbi:hypothetical protein GOBAR_DD10820 [Gossypium barbadense]|nr:hypothetical protein GOBAR_DD10820 [Gossypium barbadense]
MEVNELNNHFEKCQQLLNSIAASINSKSMTVEGQKKKLEESEQLLNQRRGPDLSRKILFSNLEITKPSFQSSIFICSSRTAF